MAAAGSAVGLGNIWGFPTQTAGNGGGAFVVVYFILAFCLAYPALMAELIIGRHTRANIVTALGSIAPERPVQIAGKSVGIYGVIIASLILSFYAIVAGWMLAYLLESITRTLGMTEISAWLMKFSLERNLLFTSLFMLLTMAIISGGVRKGIEKWSSRLMPLLILTMIALILYVLTQPGAMAGLNMYLRPDFSQISPDLIIRALGQAFFSLSLGVGTMLIYGSYISDKESLPMLGAQVTLLDCSVAFIAGMLIIPAIFVAEHYGVTVYGESGELIAGPNLIFQILPALFDSMGPIGTGVAFAFFFLMTIASVTSSISMLEVPVSLAEETTRANRHQATLIIGLLILGASTTILLNFDTMFDWVINLTTVYSEPLVGMMICIFVGWLWHRDNLLQELRTGHPDIEQTLFWKIWPNYVKFVCPVLIFLAFIQSIS